MNCFNFTQVPVTSNLWKPNLQESLDCYLIGGSKAVTAMTSSSHDYVVTQGMAQLVSENFKAINDFKEHFLALQELDIDRSSVKKVLIHHFQEITDKVFNLSM